VIERYLERIGVGGGITGRAPDRALLRELQVAHLIAVPFENLDVFHRRSVSTDPVTSIDKIVDRRRGGWCFELNGSFGWLLSRLGYDVTYASCRVHDDGVWGPDLDHCALVVRLDGERWFVDVGFGDNCMVPVPLSPGHHDGTPRPVRIRAEGERVVLAERFADGMWRDQLDIDPTPRTMDEFTPRSTYLQTEPGLLWTAKPFATRATAADGSRVTLRNGVLRVRHGTGEFTDSPVDDGDFARLANLHFDL
jgi:N-hydroxyarylamine O-acetyltransferase